jgi:hypothetical protein
LVGPGVVSFDLGPLKTLATEAEAGATCFHDFVLGTTVPAMERNARLKENQETFKLANERLEAVVGERVAAPERVPFLCECADETCMGRIDLTLEDYHDVRAHKQYFVMLPDHTRSPGEEIVARRDGYEITEKPG